MTTTRALQIWKEHEAERIRREPKLYLIKSSPRNPRGTYRAHNGYEAKPGRGNERLRDARYERKCQRCRCSFKTPHQFIFRCKQCHSWEENFA